MAQIFLKDNNYILYFHFFVKLDVLIAEPVVDTGAPFPFTQSDQSYELCGLE